MNRKGSAQIIGGIILIVLILIAAGYINIDKIKEAIFGEQHKFLVSVNTTTPIINKGQKITFSVIVLNPVDSKYKSLNPYLDVVYNESAFSTRNYDLRNDRRISLNTIGQGEQTIYYLEFSSEYYRARGKQLFSFYLYDNRHNGNLLDKREVIIYVK